jgi:hypothetical protein
MKQKRFALTVILILAGTLLALYVGWTCYWLSQVERFGEFRGDKPVFYRSVGLSAEQQRASESALQNYRVAADWGIVLLPVLLTTLLGGSLARFRHRLTPSKQA